jgi:iron complex outermembrane receptor protein
MTFGVNGMFQNNRNRGTDFLIPEYDLFDAGGFLYFQKNLNRLSLSGGVRYDNRSISTQTLFLNGENEPVSSPDSNAS